MTADPGNTPLFQPVERELVILRRFRAPRERVFRAWTDPALARQWWGPRIHPVTHLEMDARPGGRWRASLDGLHQGRELHHGGVFHEVVPPERLVFTFAWDAPGERGLETLVTITLADEGASTLMTFRQVPFQSREERDGHQGGWGSAFERLDDALAVIAGG